MKRRDPEIRHLFNFALPQSFGLQLMIIFVHDESALAAKMSKNCGGKKMPKV